ncbi:MAG: glycosyltransferase family 4 protein [Kiritimatiellae bacterium]|nr:glycosyltransferase family 4 protein [Kiritimatiellia bacterium]
MTILVIHNHYRQRGGEDSVFESECRMLENAGHRVIRYEKSNSDLHEGGLPAKIGIALSTLWSRRTVREVRALIRTEKPDVVHCHNTFPVVSPSVYFAAAREGVPVVQTLHNYRLCCLNGYLFRNGRVCEDCLGRIPWRGVCRRCYRDSFFQSAVVAAMLVAHRALGTWRRRVARYIALTEFSRGKFVAAGLPEQKIAVKPNACEPKARPCADGATIKCVAPGGPIRFLYLGRLSPEKGPDVLVEAWRILCAMPDSPVPEKAQLDIVGDGPERERLESAAADLPGMRFLGAIPKDEVPALLAGSSALVLPSRCYEQFSTTVMEAMEAGRAAAVSSSAKAGTLVRDGVSGRLFDAGNPASLAAALRELSLDPGAIRRMGEAARETFLSSGCTPVKNIAALEKIYASCTGG